jgi:hypothetical protein
VSSEPTASEPVSAEVQHRVRLVRIIAVVCACIGGLAGLQRLLLGNPEVAALLALVVAAGLGLAYRLPYSRKPDILGNLTVGLVYAGATVFAWASGPLASPASYLAFGVIPQVAVLLVGLRSGVAWVVASLLQMGGLCYAQSSGFAFPASLSSGKHQLLLYVGGMMLVLLYAGIALAHAYQRTVAEGELEQARAAEAAANKAKSAFLANDEPRDPDAHERRDRDARASCGTSTPLPREQRQFA